MTERAKKYLSDIIYPISLLDSFVPESMNFDDYSSDLKTQSAVERQLAIIGEAVNKFKKENLNKTLINGDQIVGFRNRIVHSYDTIDHAIVWAILKKHLQPLKIEVLQKIDL